MWPGRAASQRPSNILLVHPDEVGLDSLARDLAGRGGQIFYTAQAHVGRRLSQEHYFDLVVVHITLHDEMAPPLADLIARDGHRCVVLSMPADCRTLPACDLTVRGALHDPLTAEHLHRLAADVVRYGNLDGYKHHLDVIR